VQNICNAKLAGPLSPSDGERAGLPSIVLLTEEGVRGSTNASIVTALLYPVLTLQRFKVLTSALPYA
jgi:hypothetical protein